MLGGNGYIKCVPLVAASERLADAALCSDYPVGRIMRDAQLYRVGAGTQEIRRMLIGREFSASPLSFDEPR